MVATIAGSRLECAVELSAANTARATVDATVPPEAVVLSPFSWPSEIAVAFAV